jgi:glycosyltransferase involved in cell wall biosynthesis
MTHRILFTNNTLAARAGSELYVRDVAIALRRRGHTPIAYSTELGDVAGDLRRATVAVVDRLDRVGAVPNVIHGHHHLETMTALAWFPGVPAIYVCHGWLPAVERPPLHPRIARYVAVDDVVRERLVLENGIAESKVVTLLNFVDPERFQPQRALPARPRRALVFSNGASDDAHPASIRDACARAGIEVDVIGVASGNPIADPERVLGGYDIVFAKARAAMEAMACGAAVILADASGAGAMVTTRNFDELRRVNFGARSIQAPLGADRFAAEIARYDAGDAATVSARMRSEGDIRDVVSEYEKLYDAVVAERQPIDPIDDERAVARYLESWSPSFKAAASIVDRETDLLARIAELEASPLFRLRKRVHSMPALARLYRLVTQRGT